MALWFKYTKLDTMGPFYLEISCRGMKPMIFWSLKIKTRWSENVTAVGAEKGKLIGK